MNAKFRIWDEKYNCWCIDAILVYPNEEILKQGRTIQWYTGLKDKNNNPICEGDIVKWGTLNYIIEWNNTSYKWQGRCPYNSAYTVHSTTEHFRDLMCGIIVGNIFENPDLLKYEPGA